ncbi:MAG: hypothetical protein WKF86_01915, partial [Acidimicrobiales bacterium]
RPPAAPPPPPGRGGRRRGGAAPPAAVLPRRLRLAGTASRRPGQERPHRGGTNAPGPPSASPVAAAMLVGVDAG